VATVIRELEFALTQLELSIDDLIKAMQSVVLGTIPVNLLTPRVLQYIIKNVSLSLPDGYELVADSGLENMAWYYELVQVSMLASPRGFIIVLSIPLKDVNRHYKLYRIYGFFSKLSNQTFVRCSIAGD
jgi:hypothetical protein